MKNANAESCACRSVSVKMPFTAATSGSISEVMNPQAKNSVVTATNAARTAGLLIGYPPIRALRAPEANLPSSGRCGNRHVVDQPGPADPRRDERSEEHTLNSSHVKNSYAVFCLKKKKKIDRRWLI